MKKHEAHKRTPWPRFIKIGRTTVKIYRRKMLSGNWAYRIPNYSSGKRCFDCYANEAEAIEAATRLARKLSERQHVAANMTNSEAAGYAAAEQSLEPHSVPLTVAADTLAQCLQTTGTLAKLFPEDGMIQYNLACYCAQLGQLDAAKEYLDKSYELGDAKQIKLMALDDEDLKPLCQSD